MHTALLIRHGESEQNIGLATETPATIRLTARGHEQAKQVALSFAEPPDMIVTSPYQRTKETARPTLERFPHVAQAEWLVQEFSYLSPARFQNTSAKERRPAAALYWQTADPFYVDGDGAESFADFVYRAQNVSQQLKESNCGTIGIFTHQLFIQAVIWLLLAGEIPLNSNSMLGFRAFADSFSIPNGGYIQLTMRNERFWFSGVRSDHLL
jgi:broad specificity phosphatase PhoE